VVESLLTSNFYEKIVIRYGHRPNFKLLPGSGLLMMALETCNASASHDIDGATRLFFALTLDDYLGENISNFAAEALRLKCRYTKRVGLYTLSHGDGEHIDFKRPEVQTPDQKVPEGNNASTSDLEQVGAWCAEV
jgi:hypothetical protein